MFAYLFYAFRPVLCLLSDSPLISASAVSPCSELRRPPRTEGLTHTPSTSFQHLPPNSARFSYATEGALDLYLRAAVHRRGQRPPKGSGTNQTPSTGLRHPPLEEGAGKRCSECGY